VGELGAVAIERDQVRMIQTPQTFRSAILLTAFDQPYDPTFTDEATVVEKTGVTIKLVEGEETNIKITLPIDLLIAEKILEEHAKI
jgi:2-C-methyl-D-erythritol 4-phosphate cytidylyltransferase